jgi:hypothetical protein
MYSKMAFASSTRILQRRVFKSSTCIRDQKAKVSPRAQRADTKNQSGEVVRTDTTVVG